MTDSTDMDEYLKAQTATHDFVFALIRRKHKKLDEILRLVLSCEISRDDPKYPNPDLGVLWDVLAEIKAAACDRGGG